MLQGQLVELYLLKPRNKKQKNEKLLVKFVIEQEQALQQQQELCKLQ